MYIYATLCIGACTPLASCTHSRPHSFLQRRRARPARECRMWEFMMMLFGGNAVCITGPQWDDSTSQSLVDSPHKWSVRWSFNNVFFDNDNDKLAQTVEQTSELRVIPDVIMLMWHHCNVYDCPSTGMGVTKAPFVNFSVSKIFVLAKVPLRLFESRLYLTGATAAELRRHLSNINAIFNR